MTKKVLFIQPFVLDREQLSNLLLIWPVYLENFLKSKIKDIATELLYLPVEKDNGKISISSIEEKEYFFSQMNDLVSNLEFEIDSDTYICGSITTSHHYLPSKLIGEYFQKYFPNSLIIFGGAHVLACPNSFSYDNSPIDYLVMGEGEKILYEIIRDTYKKQYKSKILLGKPNHDLDDLPPINLSLLDKYIRSFNELSICLSRGCPFNCSFCMEQNISKVTNIYKRWRVYSPERAINEANSMINYALNNNIKTVGFYDPTFGAKKKWLKKFLERYSPNGDISATWIETRIDAVDEKLLQSLKKKNIFQMYGLESFSPYMLSVMDKTLNPINFLEKFERIFKIHQDLDYMFMANVLFNHPGETNVTYDESYDGLKKIYEDDKRDIALFNIRYYHHFPGTRIYNNIEHFKQKYGCVDYFPIWWENEKLLRNAPYCIRPSSELSLRKSIEKYTDFNHKLNYTNINILKKHKPENFFQKILLIKKGINTTNQLKNRLLTFLDEYRIELGEKNV